MNIQNHNSQNSLPNNGKNEKTRILIIKDLKSKLKIMKRKSFKGLDSGKGSLIINDEIFKKYKK